MKLAKIVLALIASFTGFGYFSASMFIENGLAASYIISLIGTSLTSMALLEYHMYYEAYERKEDEVEGL